jgi:hypothetical protein
VYHDGAGKYSLKILYIPVTFQRFFISPWSTPTMTPPPAATPTPTPAPSLDPASHAEMIRLTLNALPHLPNTTEAGKVAAREVVVALLAHLGPRDPLEAMLATQLVLAHYHAVITFCRMALGDLPIDLHHRYQSKAIALSRMCHTAIHDLQRRQGGAGKTVGARRASVPASHAQPAAGADMMARLLAAAPRSEAAVGAERPAGPAPVEGRHERRRREYFERRQAAAAARSPALGADAIEAAVQQLVAAEVAARAAAPGPAVAA